MPAGDPRVSVVMATYNWSAVLPFSIGSALLQRFTDFELLVVGDGCTDDSAEVVAAIRDPRVRWIGLPQNAGHQSAPNNAGLAAARGEIVAYLGHDDLWLPDHLTDLVATIDAGADVAYASTMWVYKMGEAGGLRGYEAFRPGTHLPPSSVAHRRELVTRLGGWQDSRDLVEVPETELLGRFHAAGCRLAAVPKLSVIKLPAGTRRNVYRERPCHEQAHWLERIRHDPHLATRLPIEICGTNVPAHQLRYAALLRVFIIATWERCRRRVPQLLAPRRGRDVEQLRKFKGLPRRSAHAKVTAAMRGEQ